MKKKNRKNQRNYIFVNRRNFGGFVWLCVPMPASVCVCVLNFDVQLQIVISAHSRKFKTKSRTENTH